jgi:hypothetical protein
MSFQPGVESDAGEHLFVQMLVSEAFAFRDADELRRFSA